MDRLPEAKTGSRNCRFAMDNLCVTECLFTPRPGKVPHAKLYPHIFRKITNKSVYQQLNHL